MEDKREVTWLKKEGKSMFKEMHTDRLRQQTYRLTKLMRRIQTNKNSNGHT